MNPTFTDRLDRVCDDLTALVLEADQLLSLAPTALLKMTDFDRLPVLLELAAEIAEQAQSVALLGERLGEDDEA